MDRLPEDTCFQSSAHLFGEQSQPSPDELIDALERALREVAALPRQLSPVVGFAHQALIAFQRLNAADRLPTISAYVAYKHHRVITDGDGQSGQESLAGQATGYIADQADNFCDAFSLPSINTGDLRQPLTENLAWA